MAILTDGIVRRHPRTNRVRCAWKSLIYSTRRAFLERAVVELVYKFDEKSYCVCLVSRSLKYDSNFFLSTNIHYVYTIIYYMDTTTDHFTPLALRVRGNKGRKHGNKKCSAVVADFNPAFLTMRPSSLPLHH